MKAIAYSLLCASLGLNILFGSVILRRNSSSTTTTTQHQSSPQPFRLEPPPSASPISSTRPLWQLLGSDDLPQLVANLRVAGLPPRKIAYIVLHLLREKYAALQDENDVGKEPPPYWRNSDIISDNSYNNRQKRARREDLWQQNRTEEAQLLGDDRWLAEGIPLIDHIRQANGNILSNKKLSALAELESEYSILTRPLDLNSSDPATREKLKLLEKEFKKDVALILTPEEMLERDLRYSNAAGLLQNRCNYFVATEAEYRALFPIYQQIDQAAPYSDWDQVDEKTKSARKEAETRAQAQIEAILGPARYAEFKQANDETARKENQLVTRLGLPLASAAQLVSIKADILSRAEQVRKDNANNPAERSSRLAALRTEAESRISATLGAAGLTAYREHAGGWLKIAQESGPKNTSP
ncbi:MAG: hypothetical protein QM715_20360 [Nibricoccus sp.]